MRVFALRIAGLDQAGEVNEGVCFAHVLAKIKQDVLIWASALLNLVKNKAVVKL